LVERTVTWDGFQEFIRAQFIPVDASRMGRRRLDNLKQRGRVAEYVTEFSFSKLCTFPFPY